jgi:hypothetical protein
VALATCAEFPDGYPDDGEIIAPLAGLGIDAAFAVWDDPGVDWGRFDLVVLRSTWDYTLRRDAFLDWADAVPRLMNPVAAVRWSSDKRYLRELAMRGAPCIPTRFVEPGSTAEVIAASIADVAADSSRFVVKPSVGAGSIDAGRFDSGDAASVEIAVKHTTALVESGRAVMLQPYLDGVDESGETAMVYIDGAYSHAIRKEALLHGVPTDVDGLFVEERTSPLTVTGVELDAADAVLAAAPFDPATLLYARVDLLPGPDGRPLLLELELVEPSLFLGEQPGAADRLAEAVARRCHG